MPKRSGRPSAAQTPAPKSDKIYGSSKNRKGSASTEGSSIQLSDKTIDTLGKKLKEFKKEHPSKTNINLSDLKKVYRRGSGAYSKSHKPTITGGVPNSRPAWSFARVNKFLKKAGGAKVKAAYVQDDDLMAKGGKVFNDKELLAKWKSGESIGFTGEAHLKSKGLIPRADGTKRKSMETGGEIEWGEDLGDGFSVGNDVYITDSKSIYKDKTGFVSGLAGKDLLVTISENGNEKSIVVSKKGVQKLDEPEYADGGFTSSFAGSHNNFINTMNQYEDGGMSKSSQDVVCVNCGWAWNTSDSEDFDKYVCHKCGFDNSLYYDNPLKDEVMIVEQDVMKEGGVVVGKRHSEMDADGTTGERFLVESTGQVVEVEGGEGVLSAESMSSPRKFEFQGKKMTGREIASFLNHKYGGVEFEKGGEVKNVCGCKSMYYHGGELPSAKLDSLKGGEAVITVKTMESKDKYKFGNKELTPRQILSRINEQFGGKKFDEGGVIDLSKHRFENEVKLTKMVRFTENILY